MSTEQHWVVGGGSFGCLYDYGPEYSDSKPHAIDALVFIYGDELTPEEKHTMRDNLSREGIHYFSTRSPDEDSECERLRAGADYCEITLHDGPCPDED